MFHRGRVIPADLEAKVIDAKQKVIYVFENIGLSVMERRRLNPNVHIPERMMRMRKRMRLRMMMTMITMRMTMITMMMTMTRIKIMMEPMRGMTMQQDQPSQ